MIPVFMSRADWETVAYILSDAQESGRVAYIDGIIKTIDMSLDSWEG